VETVVSDADGMVDFGSLEYGVYKVVEREAPEGYAGAFVWIGHLSKLNPEISLKAINIWIPRGSITINKTDENDRPLAGAGFSLESLDGSPIRDIFGNLVEEAFTDENGLVVFENLHVVKHYRIIETTPPQGYVGDFEQTRYLGAGKLKPRDISMDVFNERNINMLNLEANPVEGGTVTGGGEYPEGAEAGLEATAEDGWVFVSWTLEGAVISTVASFGYIMPAEATTLVANFEEETVDPGTTVIGVAGITDETEAFVEVKAEESGRRRTESGVEVLGVTELPYTGSDSLLRVLSGAFLLSALGISLYLLKNKKRYSLAKK
jgi:LPXTG-motif cell wall-anchored protein